MSATSACLARTGVGGLLERGQLPVGQVALDDPLHTTGADLGLDPEVHPETPYSPSTQAQTGRTAPLSSLTARAIRPPPRTARSRPSRS
jgi:hypothetical protein